MRRPEGITIIAIWYFVTAGMFALGLFGMAIGFIGLWSGGDFEGILMGTMGMMLGELAIAITGISFGIVGWGLMHLKPWSRGAAIVLAALSLIAVPFGTGERLVRQLTNIAADARLQVDQHDPEALQLCLLHYCMSICLVWITLTRGRLRISAALSGVTSLWSSGRNGQGLELSDHLDGIVRPDWSNT